MTKLIEKNELSKVEIWKDIKGYEGLYQVSSLGRVKRILSCTTYPNGGKRVKPEKLMKINRNKYSSVVGLTKDRKPKRLLVKYLVACAFLENSNNSEIVNNINGDKFDDNYLNLEWETQQQIEGEEWKPVVGYEGLYSVSNKGRVKSLEKTVSGLKGGEYKNPEFIMKQGRNHRGYARVGLSKDSKRTGYSVHRLVAQAFILNPESKREVNHINAVKDDNRVENLEWNTRRENTRHAMDNNLMHCGKDNKMSKLTINQVVSIKREYKEGKCTQVFLAEKYNVTPGAIWRIIRGVNWKYVN